MIEGRKKGARGFTLTELLVVVAIGALVTAAAIPAIANLGIFSRNELKGTARELYSLLQAARMYAASQNVNCAVVYVLDNYETPEARPTNDPGLAAPVMDPDPTVNRPVRLIVGAALMYELPASSKGFQHKYVPVPGDEGNFQTFQRGMVIPLELSKRYSDDVADNIGQLYSLDTPRLDPSQNLTGVAQIGLTVVPMYPEGHGANVPGALPEDPAALNDFQYLLAHVFTPAGKLTENTNLGAPKLSKERFTFFVTPPPDTDSSERFDTNGKIVNVPIEINKSSGRIRLSPRD